MDKSSFMTRILFVVSVLLFFGGCSTSSTDGDSRALPAATGKAGDMIILMDSLQWKGELGEEVRKIFTPEVNGLPRSETMFNVIWVHPNKKIKLLTQIRNLVYVFTLDQSSVGTKAITDNLSKETLNTIKTDTGFYLVNKKDEYSRGQEVMYLFGRTKEDLIKHLRRDGSRIQDFFNGVEKRRLTESLKKTTSTKHHTELLKKDYNISLHLPAGFQLAQHEKDFVWFRSPETEIDKNFFVARKPYESEYQLLPDSILAWRESICKKYIFEDPDRAETYITIESNVPYNPTKARQVSFNGRFAMELRGLWRTNTKTMGGPFICYTFVNEADNQLYYIEGFVYSPGKPQRELIREMETIAFTFEPVTKQVAK